eukprot:813926-Prymnesium_polylepis.1
MVGFTVALFGFYTQWQWGFALPFPFNIIMFPFSIIECTVAAAGVSCALAARSTQPIDRVSCECYSWPFPDEGWTAGGKGARAGHWCPGAAPAAATARGQAGLRLRAVGGGAGRKRSARGRLAIWTAGRNSEGCCAKLQDP